MLLLKVPIPATIFLIPIPIILVALFSLGVGLILASYSIFFPDIAEMYPVFLRALIYMSPVIVPEDRLAAILDGWVLKINPLYYLIKIFRQLIVEGTIPSIRIFGISILISLLFLVFGLLIFTARSDKFAYYG
jgi:ABC-2 type transport system permease protein